MVAAWLRSMNRRRYYCWNLVYAVETCKPERLELIVDIPVPQIEEEIAEVDRFLHCAKQYLELLLSCVVRVMCLSEHSSMRMHADFQLFSV